MSMYLSRFACIDDIRYMVRVCGLLQGTLVKALKQGDWILLDEINLASAELLECLSGLLESTSGSVLLTERGSVLKLQSFCRYYSLYQ